jgi:hypothetical protein
LILFGMAASFVGAQDSTRYAKTQELLQKYDPDVRRQQAAQQAAQLAPPSGKQQRQQQSPSGQANPVRLAPRPARAFVLQQRTCISPPPLSSRRRRLVPSLQLSLGWCHGKRRICRLVCFVLEPLVGSPSAAMGLAGGGDLSHRCRAAAAWDPRFCRALTNLRHCSSVTTPSSPRR